MNESSAGCGAATSPTLLALMRAAAVVAEALERGVEPLGLSVAKMGVLQQLAVSAEPLSLGQLAERLRCVKSNVTQLMDRLESDGLVRRARDPRDGRTVLALITDEGRRRFAAASEARVRVEQALLSALADDDRATLTALLGRVAGQAGARPDRPLP